MAATTPHATAPTSAVMDDQTRDTSSLATAAATAAAAAGAASSLATAASPSRKRDRERSQPRGVDAEGQPNSDDEGTRGEAASAHLTTRRRLDSPQTDTTHETSDREPTTQAKGGSLEQQRRFHCDNNSISLVLSCLNSKDFASAHRVSRQWRSSSQLASAWPHLDLEHVIARGDFLADGRRVLLGCLQVTKVLASPVYSRTNQIELWPGADSGDLVERVTSSALQQLPQFRHLTSLRTALQFNRCVVAANEFAVAMADRLHVLQSCWPFPQLGLLHQLRVLDGDCPPPDQLLQLKQLRCLRLCEGQGSANLMRIVRYLSTQHQLTSLTVLDQGEAATAILVSPNIRTEAAMIVSPLEEEEEPEDEEDEEEPEEGAEPRAFRGVTLSWPSDTPAEVPPAGVRRLRLGVPLTRECLEDICAMPCLERLESFIEDPYGPIAIAGLARLQHFTLGLTPNFHQLSDGSATSFVATDAPILALCTNLRSLTIDMCERSSHPHILVNPATCLAGLTRLEDCTFADNAYIAPESSWEVVATLTQLRHLKISVVANLTALSSHLALLPHFVSLELMIWPKHAPDLWNDRPAVVAGLIQSMAQATSWRILRLHLDTPDGLETAEGLTGMEALMAAQSSPSSNSRLRVLISTYDQLRNYRSAWMVARVTERPQLRSFVRHAVISPTSIARHRRAREASCS